MTDAAAAPPTRLDRLIAWVAPQRALRRVRARVALDALRAFEGAARSRRTEGWRVASGTGPNTELAPALCLLRDRSRDHVRNNPYGRRAVRHLASTLVGYGITGTVTGRNKANVAALQTQWDAWADEPTCDQRGKQTFCGLQRLVARELLESGEVLARRVWDADAPMGFRVQVLEPDYLDAGLAVRENPTTGYRICAGIEYDANDRPVAYWILPYHPGDTWAGTLQPPNRIAASEIAHVFDEERAGQGRGYPLLTPVMIALRDLDECRDAQLVKQKIAACFAVMYTTPDGTTRTRPGELCDHVEPGMIEELPGGWEATVVNPPDVGGYNDVMRGGLQAVAAGTGVPYEDISGDFSQFNFSSGRMSRGAFYAAVEELQWQVLIPGFLDRVFAWFLDAATIVGFETAGVSMTWTCPRRALVDPARETPPLIDAVRATLSSPQEALRSLGYDPDAVLRDWQAFAKQLDDAGLVSDIDPRRTTNIGGRVAPPESATPAPPPPAGRSRRRRPLTNGHAPAA